MISLSHLKDAAAFIAEARKIIGKMEITPQARLLYTNMNAAAARMDDVIKIEEDRRGVPIVKISAASHDCMYALCADNSVWMIQSGVWGKLPFIPDFSKRGSP